MGNIFRINCREVYKSGVYINSQISVLDQLLNDMKSINDGIKESWDGYDYENFCNNFSEYLSSIETLETSLVDKVSLLKSVAIKHGSIDKSLSDELKRGHIDER